MSNFDALFTTNAHEPQHYDAPAEAPIVPASPSATGNRVDAYPLEALRRESERVAMAHMGERNNTLNAAAFNMGRHIGAGSIDQATVNHELTAAAIEAGLSQDEVDRVLRHDSTSALHAGAKHPRFPRSRPGVHKPPWPSNTFNSEVGGNDRGGDADSEEEFWNRRPLLRHLCDFARSRMVSPWAVLGSSLAYISTATPYQVQLPPIVGTNSSLNLFVALVGHSGAGKGAAATVAREAFDVGPIKIENAGSGEGIAHGFKRRINGGDTEWLDDKHAVCLHVPEIDTMNAQGSRRGATLLPQLRSAWSGEHLGFGYADSNKRLPIEAHQYRLCVLLGVQPLRAEPLIGDAGGGTPQRFLWMPAEDPGAPDVAPPAPIARQWEGVSIQDSDGHPRVVVMQVCSQAETLIRSAQRLRLRDGNAPSLDGHALLMQLKVAAILAIADGQLSVTEDDWDLAGSVMRKSDTTRSYVEAQLRSEAAASNEKRAHAEASRQKIVRQGKADDIVARGCRSLVKKLESEGGWMTRSDLLRHLGGRSRDHLDEMLDSLAATGAIEGRKVARDERGRGGRGMRYRVSTAD